MSNNRINIRSALGGESLAATIYALIYTLYTIAFTMQLNLYIIRLLYGAFYSLSVWYFFKIIITKEKSSFIKALNFFVFLILIYGVILLLVGVSGKMIGLGLDKSGFILAHLYSVLPLYTFYYFGKKCKLTPTWFSLMFIIFLLDAYLLYEHNRITLIERAVDVEEGFTNNSGYVWASLLPILVFYDRRRVLQYIFLAVTMIFVLMCFKRGAVLSSVVMLLYFLFQSIRNNSFQRKIITLLFGAVLLILLIRFFYSLLENNSYFLIRYENTMEGDSSGRDYIYKTFFDYIFSHENSLGIIWGNGANGTAKILGIQAHNDWLEYTIDMGIIGLLAYLIYWVTIFINYFKSKGELPQTIITAMGMVIILNIIRTFLSMSFNDMSFFTSSILGYTMALADKAKVTSSKKSTKII